MLANDRQLYFHRSSGFSALELVVTVAVISLVALVALQQFYKLLVDVERSKLELDLTTFRSALSLQVANYYAKGNLAELKTLVASNPIDLLPDKPENYLGILNEGNLDDAKRGSWFYDDQSHALVYVVKNGLYFETPLVSPPRVSFRVEPVYSESHSGPVHRYLTGLVLRAQQPYRWRSPWK